MGKQKVAPFLSFTGDAEEAMNYYASVFPGAEITSLVRFGRGQPNGDEGKVLHGVLSIGGQQILFLDMQPAYPAPAFNWASSLYVDCESEAEFDAIFEGLAREGSVMMGPEALPPFRKVAWVTDRFGVTWQPVWE